MLIPNNRGQELYHHLQTTDVSNWGGHIKMVVQFKRKTGSRGIEWTDITHNRTGGCLHECVWIMDDGTRVECWAKGVAEKLAKRAYEFGFEHHYWREGNAGDMRRRKTPSLVFIDSMSDLFGHWVPDDHIRTVLEEVKLAPQHIGQVLTKNAPRILEYLDILPDNLWVGVSSPPDEMWGRPLMQRQQSKLLGRQLAVLSKVRAARPELVTWMSIEPLSWDISGHLRQSCPLQWAVIGAATNGPKAYQPAADDVRSALEVLDSHRVPVFFKGNLQWPEWREDFPAIQHPALAQRRRMAEKHGWTPSRCPLDSQ